MVDLRTMTLSEATQRAIDIRLKKAEDAITRELLSVEHDVMKRIDQVRVDTRNFANCGVEIFLADK